MDALSRAKSLFESGGYTCVVVSGDSVYTSDKRGVKPLMELVDGSDNWRGAAAADKIVGRAAAFIYVYLGVSRVYAEVMSRAAIDILQANGIGVEYSILTDRIVNRRGDGICPMEEAVEGICDCKQAIDAIRQRLKKLEAKGG